jgi:hypothetical protein
VAAYLSAISNGKQSIVESYIDDSVKHQQSNLMNVNLKEKASACLREFQKRRGLSYPNSSWPRRR